MMPLASPEMRSPSLTGQAALGVRCRDLDRKAAMARQRPHIIAVGQGALRHQHAVGPGSGFGRPQFGGRKLGRRSGDGGCSRFRGRVRGGHESVRDRNPALNPGAGRKTYRAHAGRAARHGTQASAWPPHDTHVLRYDCENDCKDARRRPAIDTRNHSPGQRMRVLPISLARYHQKVWCRPVASAAIIWTLAAMALVVIAGSAQAQPHMPQPRELAPAPSPYPGILGSATAAGAARSLAPVADPLHDRDGLPAVQLRRSGRASGRLQRRSGAADLRGAESHLHDPDAPLRHAGAGAE